MDIVVRRIAAGEGRLLRDVRLAALADAPSAFGSTYAGEVGRSDEEWEERARLGSVGGARATFFAVREDGRVVGLAGGYRDDEAPGDVHLVSMWADPVARRSGVGRALVQAVVDWATETGADVVRLWVTRGNDAAHALYLRMGFEDTGDVQPLPSDPCKDEIAMTRVVATSGRR